MWAGGILCHMLMGAEDKHGMAILALGELWSETRAKRKGLGTNWKKMRRRGSRRTADMQFRSLVIVLANVNAHHRHTGLWSRSFLLSAGIENIGQDNSGLWETQNRRGIACINCGDLHDSLMNRDGQKPSKKSRNYNSAFMEIFLLCH